ncbi:MAG TPA: TonB family protein [Acidobacteriaceae bacterium]
MPITETQTDAAPPPSEPPRTPRRGGRQGYEGLESYDLLHIIDDLEDERARALLREKIWIALLLHVLVFLYLLFGPRYIHHVRVVDPSTEMRDHEQQMTMLNLPPDALKTVRPKQAAPTPEESRPHVDTKTLEALRRQAPPPPPTRQPEAPRPQTAEQQPPTPPPVQRPALPLPQNQAAQVEAPAPRPTQPNFTSGPATPGEAVEQAARQASRGGYSGGGDGVNAPGAHGGMNGAVDVLSPTLGVDFGPYIQRVIYDTKRAWYPIIPPSAQPPLSKQGRVLIRFKIMPDGSVKEMTLEGPSGDVSLDRAAWGGIKYGAPFPPLPKDFKGPFLELRFYFLYNERPGVQ